MDMRIVDLKDKTFGRLTVVRVTGESRGGSKTWECLCSCGNTVVVSTRHLNRKDCNIRSCGCLTADKVGAIHQDWRGIGEMSGSFWTSHVVRSARGNEKGRGPVSLTITKEDVWELYQQQKGKCALTGVDITFPSRHGDKLWTASLDRIDSSKGYDPGNVQWVHKHINIMKNVFSQDYFIEMCNLVASGACPIK